MLYQGSQKETRRAKVAGPATRSFAFSACRRCRDLPARLGAGRGLTDGLMAAPQLGQSAVPGNTSTRQREQAGTPARLLVRTTVMVPGSLWWSFSACSRCGRPLSDTAGVSEGVRLPRARSPIPLFRVMNPMPSTRRLAEPHSPGSLLVGSSTLRADMNIDTGRGPNGRSTLLTVVSRAPTPLHTTLAARRPHSSRTRSVTSRDSR